MQKKRVNTKLVFIIILSLIMQLMLTQVIAEEADGQFNIGGMVGKFLSVSIRDEDGKEVGMTTEAALRLGQGYGIYYELTLDHCQEATTTEQLILEVPKAFIVKESNTVISVKVDGTQDTVDIGTLEITADNKVIVSFNEKIKDYNKVDNMYLYVGVKFNKQSITGGETEIIPFQLGNVVKEYVLYVDSSSQKALEQPQIHKEATTYDKANRTIEWTILVTAGQAEAIDYEVIDDIDITKLTFKKLYVNQEEASASDYSYDQTTGKLVYKCSKINANEQVILKVITGIKEDNYYKNGKVYKISNTARLINKSHPDEIVGQSTTEQELTINWIEKTGVILGKSERIEDKPVIEWTIKVNGIDQEIKGATLIDLIPPEVELIDYSYESYSNVANDNYVYIQDAETKPFRKQLSRVEEAKDLDGTNYMMSTPSQIDITDEQNIYNSTEVLMYKFPEDAKPQEYTFTYRTVVRDLNLLESNKKCTVNNKVLLKDLPALPDQIVEGIGQKDITSIMLHKTGKQVPNTNRIRWEVTINTNEIQLNEVNLTDYIMDSQQLVPGSVKLATYERYYKDKSIAQEITSEGITYDAGHSILVNASYNYVEGTESGLLTCTLRDKDNKNGINVSYVIVYETVVTNPDYYAYNTKHRFENRVIIKPKKMIDRSKNETKDLMPTQVDAFCTMVSHILSKESTAYNSAEKTIKWKVIVNSDGIKLAHSKLTDYLGTSQKLLPETMDVRAYVNKQPVGENIASLIGELKDSVIIEGIPGENWTYTFKQSIDKPYIITYETELTDEYIQANLKNAGTKTVTNACEFIGDPMDKPQRVDAACEFNNTILTKTGDLLEGGRHIGWKIKFNENYMTLSNVKIIDELADGLRLELGTVNLYKIDAYGNKALVTTGYEYNIDENNKLTLDITKQIEDCYQLEFITFVKEDATKEYSNEASLWGSIYDDASHSTAEPVKVQFIGAGGSIKPGEIIVPTQVPDGTPVPTPKETIGPGETPVPTPKETTGSGETPVPTPEETRRPDETPVPTPKETTGPGEIPVPTPEGTIRPGETLVPTVEPSPTHKSKKHKETTEERQGPTPEPSSSVPEATSLAPEPSISTFEKSDMTEEKNIEIMSSVADGTEISETGIQANHDGQNAVQDGKSLMSEDLKNQSFDAYEASLPKTGSRIDMKLLLITGLVLILLGIGGHYGIHKKK